MSKTNEAKKQQNLPKIDPLMNFLDTIPLPPKTTITPKIAELLLTNNPLNRHLNNERVDRYSKEMDGDKWQFNGETIKICEDTSLIDGQHRLASIIKSGKSQDIVIIKDLPRTVFSTIDIGRKRTLVDLLHIKGYMYTDKIAGAARLISMFNQNREIIRSSMKNRSLLSIDELFELIQEHPTLQNDAIYAMKKLNTLVKIIGSPNTVALLHLFKEKDEPLALSFLESLNTGHMLDMNSVVYSCRELLYKHRAESSTGRYTNSSYILYLIVKTWNSLRNGTHDVRLVVDHSLPIPVIQ